MHQKNFRLCLVFAWLALTFAACHSRPSDSDGASPSHPPTFSNAAAPTEVFRLHPLVVRDLTTPADRPVDLSGNLEEWVRQSVGHSGLRVGAQAAKGEIVCEAGFAFYYALTTPDGKVLRSPGPDVTMVLGITAFLRHKRPGDLPLVINDEIREEQKAEVAAADLPALLTRHLKTLLDKLVHRLEVLLATKQASDDELIAQLRAVELWPRTAAAAEIGERGLSAAVPALIDCLRANDSELHLKIVGALARLGDRRAVRPLAALTQGPDLELTRQVVFALGDIGGPEARRYLETLAVSHPATDIREEAGRQSQRLAGN